MDRYVDYHLRLITTHPIDILAVTTFLPEILRADYDRLWTARRARTIIDALVKFNVALEIDSRLSFSSAERTISADGEVGGHHARVRVQLPDR